jgi:dTDP-4-amino-4,6-dideoxygalactose transaminase
MMRKPQPLKAGLNDFALFGGSPAFSEKLHVGRPNIGDRQRLQGRINDILDRKWLTNNGPYVRELEGRIAKMTGARNCIAMCNATVALQIAIKAAGLVGEVIVPSFTFVATVHALYWQGVTPVFCDVDPRTHTIDPDQVEQLITPRTTGIIGVHLWGRPCEIDRLTDIARGHDLKLLFDAAHAFACSYNGRMIGRFGDAEVFSFHAAKFLNTFEGGAVVTDDDKLATKIRLMRNFGFAGYDDVVHIGVNGKMSEVAAAMGLTSLESLEKFVAVNRQNYHHYRQELAGIPGVYLTTYDETQHCNYQYIVLEIDEALTRIGRDTLVNILRAENVLARRYFYPGVHRMEPYRSYFPHAGLLLTSTDRLTKRVLCLPTGTAIDVGEISKICQIIRFAVTHGDEVRERWSRSTSTDLYMH